MTRELDEFVTACRDLAERARAMTERTGDGADGAEAAKKLFVAAGHLATAADAVCSLRLEDVDDTVEPRSAPPEPKPTENVLKRPAGLHGSSRDIAMPELLAFLGSQGKSGKLVVRSSSEEFLVELDLGEVVHASSSNSPRGLRLGEILIGLKAVEREDLERFVTEHAQPGKGGAHLGESLEEAGLVTREKLRAALEFQVQHIFHRLFAAGELEYSFFDGHPEKGKSRVRLNTTHLLLDSARAKDEASAGPKRS